MATIKQFDIWLADLNPQFGTETGKTRPVLILQTDLLNNRHPSTLICPVTTNVRRNISILRVNLEVESTGLRHPSAVMIDQLRAIDNKRLLRKIGSVSNPLQEKILENIQIVLGIE
ncbi:MAG: type II toxin-antitoxin system PemK/MazF family toxin [Bacteroidia bacterium]